MPTPTLYVWPVVSAIIPNGQASLTLVAGVDYPPPPYPDRCFASLANTRMSGMGRTVGGGNQNSDDYSVHISDQSNIGTNITLTRSGLVNDCRVQVELKYYIGRHGDPNEFIIRGSGVASTAGQVASGAILTNIIDPTRCVVYITGQSSDSTTTRQALGHLFTSSLDPSGADWQPAFTRGAIPTPVDTGSVSYVVVEYGANWSVRRHEFTATGAAWAPGDTVSFNETITPPLADAQKAFGHYQYRTDNDDTGLDDAGDAFRIETVSALKIFNRTITGSRVKVAWIVSNSQNDLVARNLNVQHIDIVDDTTTGAEERAFTATLPLAVANTTQAFASLTASMDGASFAFSRGYINWLLSTNDQIALVESDAGQERRLSGDIVEFPEDPALPVKHYLFFSTLEGTGRDGGTLGDLDWSIDGTYPDGDPFRPRLHRYTTEYSSIQARTERGVGAGEFMVLCYMTDTQYANALSDPDITEMIPIGDVSFTDTFAAAYDAPTIQAAKNVMESRNIPVDDIAGSNTILFGIKRAVWRFQLRGLLLADDYVEGLDLTVGDVPPVKRSAMNARLTSLGFDTSGLTLGTLVRDAIRYFIDQKDLPTPETSPVAKYFEKDFKQYV